MLDVMHLNIFRLKPLILHVILLTEFLYNLKLIRLHINCGMAVNQMFLIFIFWMYCLFLNDENPYKSSMRNLVKVCPLVI